MSDDFFKLIIEPALDAVVDKCIRGQLKIITDQAYEAVCNMIKEREEAHGRCPRGMQDALLDQACLMFGEFMYLYRKFPEHNLFAHGVTLPPKGSKIRKEYDLWMRRVNRER